MHPVTLDRLVNSLERVSEHSDLPPDYVLLADLDELRDVRLVTQKKWLRHAKAELVRRQIQERVDEIAEAANSGDEMLVDILAKAFPEDLKLQTSLNEKDRRRWIEKANLAAHSNDDDPESVGSVIYFIGTDDVHIKIGFTTNLRVRLRSLRTASPNPIQIHALIPGTFDYERELHRRFAAFHVRGEWFKSSPEIKTFIANYRGERG